MEEIIAFRVYSNRGWASPHLISNMEIYDEERCMYKNLNYGNFNETYDIRNFDIALDRIKLAYTFMIGVSKDSLAIWRVCRICLTQSISVKMDFLFLNHVEPLQTTSMELS